MRLKGIGFFLLLMFAVVPTTEAFENIHRVQGTLSDMYTMTPHFRVIDKDLIYQNGTAYIRLKTQGNCKSYYTWRCHDGYRYPGGYYDTNCGDEQVFYCETETGYYALPKEEIAWDGKKRLKFIKDGRNLTIARWGGLPFFKRWKMREYVTFEVEDDLAHVNLIIFEPEK